MGRCMDCYRKRAVQQVHYEDTVLAAIAICIEKPNCFLVADVHRALSAMHNDGYTLERILIKAQQFAKKGYTEEIDEELMRRIRFWAGLYLKSPRNVNIAPNPTMPLEGHSDDDGIELSDDPMDDSVSAMKAASPLVTDDELRGDTFAVPMARPPTVCTAASVASSSTVQLGSHTLLPSTTDAVAVMPMDPALLLKSRPQFM